MKKSDLTAIIFTAIITLFLIKGSAFGADALVVDQSGNVGIGTTSPNALLDVNGIGLFQRTGLAYDSTPGAGFTGLYIQTDSPNITHLDSYGSGQTNTEIAFGTTYLGTLSEAMRIDENGKVGIGTTAISAVAKLHVVGNIYADGGNAYIGGIIELLADTGYRIRTDNTGGDLQFQERGAGRTDLVIQRSSGNVGIGTTSQFGSGAGVLSIKNASTNPTSSPSGAALFYASSGEMYVRDSNGNDTCISPHPSEEIEALAESDDPYPYILKMRNQLIGKELIIDLGKAIRLLQTLFPQEEFIWYRDIEKLDSQEHERMQRDAWKEDWIQENTEEVEILKGEAFEFIEIEKEDRSRVVGEEISYKLDGTEVIEVREPEYAKITVQEAKLKDNVTFDTKTGKFIMKRVPTDSEAEDAAKEEFEYTLRKWIKERM